MLEKQLAAEKALDFIKPGMIVGLGTGSTVYYAIKKIAEQIKTGLAIKAVSTSISTTKLARSLNIPLLSIDDVEEIDITIDGADEVDMDYHGIKGGGGALFREKIVASISKKNVWVVDSSKLVNKIGYFPLPIEVLPFGYTHVMKKLAKKDMKPLLRKEADNAFVTDSGNYIIDLQLKTITDPPRLAAWLCAIPGIVEHGLFINMVDTIIVGQNSKTEIINNNKSTI